VAQNFVDDGTQWTGIVFGLASEQARPMPITQFLDDQKFDPEIQRILGVAFEMAHAAVQRDWGDCANSFIAKKIIELRSLTAKTGVRVP